MIRPFSKGVLAIGVLFAALVTAASVPAKAVFPLQPAPYEQIVTFTAFHCGDITHTSPGAKPHVMWER